MSFDPHEIWFMPNVSFYETLIHLFFGTPCKLMYYSIEIWCNIAYFWDLNQLNCKCTRETWPLWISPIIYILRLNEFFPHTELILSFVLLIFNYHMMIFDSTKMKASHVTSLITKISGSTLILSTWPVVVVVRQSQ